MIYDIIGDIHGHASALRRLLEKLGYSRRDGAFRHADGDRMAIFLGDFVDRGPEIPEALGIVRAMIDGGWALAVLGNHEYNAIGFHTPLGEDAPEEPSGWLRSRSDKHIFQHIETLYQFRNLRSELADYIKWLRTLPLYLDFPGFRVVHAAWTERAVGTVKKYSTAGNLLTRDFLIRSAVKGSEEHKAIEELLKGVRLSISKAKGFLDKDGNFRTTMRTRWWDNTGRKSYRDLGFPPGNVRSDEPVGPGDLLRVPGYDGEKPVFIGHYWLKDMPPMIQSSRICCLDYSIAKDGVLAAYTWRGEAELAQENITWVR